MQNNKFYILLAFFAAVSCTKKSPETLLSRWEKKADSFNVLERKLASSTQGQCLTDIFTVETLRQEVKDLEKKYAGAPRVSGSWKHLDLSRLPVPQANFLKTYGNEIGDLKNPSNIDYSSCENVPCLYNKIYGKDDDVAGYVHYIWYLKLGHMLSADNKIPEQISKIPGEYNGEVHSLSSYLFNEKELYGLWRLSNMLKQPHTTLKYLKELQRVPRGQLFEGENYKGACGLASSTGWIKVTDGCLTITPWSNDVGYLYQAVTHELTHQIDFEEGRGSKDFYRSHKPDYLNVSGMYINEYVDTNGKNVRQWALKPGAKLVSTYAGTAPEENFAESLAIFRVEGDTAKKNVTDDHFSFVSNEYYFQKSFEKEEMIKGWIEKYAPDTGKLVFSAVIECSKNTTAPKSTFFKANQFSAPVLPGMLNCISSRAEEISNQIKGKTSLYEPDGCKAINDFTTKGKWEIYMKEHLLGVFNKYLQELKNDKEYIARIQNYSKELSDKTIARAAYLNCYGNSDEEACYQQEIQKGALDRALTLNLPEFQTKEMADMYVSYHPFMNIKNDTLKSYQIIVSSHLELIRKEAETTWEGCLNISHNDDQTPSGSLFQIADGYMISSFYNCLNMNIPDAIKESVRSINVEGLKVQHAKEEIILTSEVQPQFIKILKEFYTRERDKELKKSKEVAAKDKGALRSQIASDFNWVKNIVDSKQIASDCEREAIKLIPFQPLYHLKKDLFGELAEKSVCLNIQSAPEFTKWMESSKVQFESKITTSLEAKLLDLGTERADECLKKFPMDTAVNKIKFRKEREACLVDEWPKIEASVISSALRDPMVMKLKIPVDDLKSKVEGNRRRLQLRLIKEKF